MTEPKQDRIEMCIDELIKAAEHHARMWVYGDSDEQLEAESQVEKWRRRLGECIEIKCGNGVSKI